MGSIFTMSEELKESLSRAKGEGYFVMGVVDGNVVMMPDCFDVKKQTKNHLVLVIRKPAVPNEAKKALVAEVIAGMEDKLKESIADAVKQSLLEKPLSELMSLKEAKDIKVQRRRGCLWLITENTEHVI